jgi:hypothetical protein
MNSQSVELAYGSGEGCLPALDAGRSAQKSLDSRTLLLLVIDARRARIYKVRFAQGDPQQVIPYDPFGYRRRSDQVWDFSFSGSESIPQVSLAAVARTLGGIEQVLIFANGHGAVRIMGRFLEYFAEHHPALNRRLIGSMTLNEPEPTEQRLLPHVREFCELLDA